MSPIVRFALDLAALIFIAIVTVALFFAGSLFYYAFFSAN